MLHYWMNLICTLMFPMFFGIGQGPSQGQQTAAANLGSLGEYDTTQGENVLGTGLGDLSNVTGFWNSILSGDPTKISQVLGPQFGVIQGQAQQGIDTAGEFGNRSGGTNASIQNTTNSVRAADQNLIGNLTGAAASNIGNIGSTLLSGGEGLLGQASTTDASAFNAQTTMQQEQAAQWNDIFNSIGQIAGGAITAFSDN